MDYLKGRAKSIAVKMKLKQFYFSTKSNNSLKYRNVNGHKRKIVSLYSNRYANFFLCEGFRMFYFVKLFVRSWVSHFCPFKRFTSHVAVSYTKAQKHFHKMKAPQHQKYEPSKIWKDVKTKNKCSVHSSTRVQSWSPVYHSAKARLTP